MDKTEEYLFHYTNVHGLIGILKGRCIWASEISLLSDISEYITAIDMIKNLTREFIPDLEDQRGDGEFTTLDRLVDVLLEIHKTEAQNIFVASFTREAGNSLNQWRAYCPIGGYSLGFDAEYIMSTFPGIECIYRKKEQERYIQDRAGKYIKSTMLPWIRENMLRLFSDPDIYETEGYMQHINYMKEISPPIKHWKYEDEREWRIVKPSGSDSDILYRPGKYFPIPYIKLPIELSEIKQVAIGPCPERQVSYRALSSILASEGISPSIVVDTIPYRSW